MKILNTYKQSNITWFEYKYLLGLTEKLHTFTNAKNSTVSRWLNSSELTITKRTKDIL